MKRTRRHWSDDLKTIEACAPAVRYARKFPTFRKAWEACDRSDWIMWLLYALDAAAEPGDNIPSKSYLLGASANMIAYWARKLATLSIPELAKALRDQARRMKAAQ